MAVAHVVRLSFERSRYARTQFLRLDYRRREQINFLQVTTLRQVRQSILVRHAESHVILHALEFVDEWSVHSLCHFTHCTVKRQARLNTYAQNIQEFGQLSANGFLSVPYRRIEHGERDARAHERAEQDCKDFLQRVQVHAVHNQNRHDCRRDNRQAPNRHQPLDVPDADLAHAKNFVLQLKANFIRRKFLQVVFHVVEERADYSPIKSCKPAAGANELLNRRARCQLDNRRRFIFSFLRILGALRLRRVYHVVQTFSQLSFGILLIIHHSEGDGGGKEK